MADTNISWSSQDAEVLKSFQRMQQQVEKLTGKLAQTGDTSKKVSKEAETGMQKWQQQTRENIASYDLLGDAVGAVVTALKEQVALQEKIANTQRTAAQSERAFLRNLGNVSPEERDQARGEIRRIASATGVKQADLFDAASTAMSAKGALSPMEAMKSVEMAARVAPESKAELTNFAGALLDVQALTKSQDPEANLGFLVGMQAQARTTTLTQTAQNLLPGAIGVAGYGGTPQESAALLTTMTQAMKDPTGAVAATSSISLAEQLAKFEPLKDLKETDDRIRFLQANEGLRDEFLEKASFEKKAGIPVRDLLTAGSDTARLWEQNIAKMPGADELRDNARKFLGNINDTPLQKAADDERRAEQEIEDYDLSDFRSGDKARVRKRVNDLLGRSGASEWSPAGTLYARSNDPNVMGERMLTSRANQIRDESPLLANKMDEAVKELQAAHREAQQRAEEEKIRRESQAPVIRIEPSGNVQAF